MTGEAPLLPIFLKMKDRPCLLVGGGNIALEKIRVLVGCETSVCVVAPETLSEIDSMARDGKILLRRKHYTESDLAGTSFVIAATSDRELNHRVYTEARAQGRLVNVVDDPEYCDFYFGSIVRRGSLQVAVSTGGESPAFARQLKEEIGEALPPDIDSWLARLGELRRAVNQKVASGPERISLLRELAKREICELATCPFRTLVTGEWRAE